MIGGAEVVVLVILLLAFVPGVCAILCGHYLLFAVGLLTAGIVWLGTFVMTPRPNSWWARRSSTRAA